MGLRQVRKKAGVSQLHVAAISGTSLPTVRLFEADPKAVSDESQQKLGPVYADLAKRVAAGVGR